MLSSRPQPIADQSTLQICAISAVLRSALWRQPISEGATSCTDVLLISDEGMGQMHREIPAHRY